MEIENIGERFGEIWHLLLHDENANSLIQIENIGITKPNPDYGLSRNDKNLFVIEYIVSGREYLKVENKDYIVEAGDTCIIEPFSKHSYHSDPKNPVEKKWINFTSKIFSDLYENLGLKGQIIFHNFNSENYFEELLLLASKAQYSDEISFEVFDILSSLIIKLKKYLTVNIENEPSKTAKLVKNYIDSCVFKNTNLDELAKIAMYSKKQVTREFKKYYNDTPYNYLITLKIKAAKRLLEITDMPIKEIADRLCFENQHYFSKAFKRKVGVSPTEYKKNFTA